jgi:circadian clock protein KaiA
MVVSDSRKDASQISVCLCLQSSTELGSLLDEIFASHHYSLARVETSADLLDVCTHQVDCLIIEEPRQAEAIFAALEENSILLPAILLIGDDAPSEDFGSSGNDPDDSHFFYHPAEIKLEFSRLTEKLPHAVCQGIANFMRLSVIARADKRESFQAWFSQPPLQAKLKQQQERLSEKLKERLGYLGVYYKRDPKQFLRHLAIEERKVLIDELKEDYRQIVLGYFNEEREVNTLLDAFVTKAFFADASVIWLLEMHMELMDSFSKLLKLEGRSDEVLLDYRLTLIDAIAHLSEMYRLSIPKEA